ncbi:Serine/threonine-protein kinase stk11 [Geranomyces michiganensis]|nr:Serine/threonine-protein kinase stk11 [Geranomyces michiganensis]
MPPSQVAIQLPPQPNNPRPAAAENGPTNNLQSGIAAGNVGQMVSMSAIDRAGVPVGSSPAPNRNRMSGISVPDVTRLDFIVGGPGIGASSASSTGVAPDGAMDSRRGSARASSGNMHGGGGVPDSRNSSRRPTFQGKSALMISVQKRMSAVDVSQLGVSGAVARADGGHDSRSSFGGSSGHSLDATPEGRPPMILMYPRKEVMIATATSLSSVNSRSRGGSVISLRRPSGSKMGSASALAGTGHPAVGSASVDSVTGRPQGGSKGSRINSIAGVHRPDLMSKNKLAGSVSMGALAAAGSARESLSKRNALQQRSSAPGSRIGSACFIPSTFGSAPASARGSAVDVEARKRSSSLLRPASDEKIEFAHDEDEDKLAPMDDAATHSPVTAATQASSPAAFESRPMSTVGAIEDTYRTNPEYYEYLLLAQRHASSNFIHKMDSSEVVWKTESAKTKMIGRYLLADQIGKGAFGKVKEGLCSETLQRVAVKIINKKRLRKMPGGVESAIREIKLLRRMRHRNAIRLIDVYCKVEDEDGNVGVFNWFSTIEDEPITWKFEDGSEDDRNVQILKWYLIFEYCPCSLQTLLEQEEGGRLSIPRAHWFFVQLMEGVSYLHSQGVIHRDIKAGNMLITPDNTLKISDFGIAEQFSTYSDAQMNISSFAGTHQFLSPELAEGVAQCNGEPVDVWACGITLFNMLTGRYPFEFDEDGNMLQLYEKIVEGTFDMPPEFDEDLQDLLRGMLTKDPLKRSTTAEILLHPWTRSTHFFDNLPPPVLMYPVPETDGATTPTAFKSSSSPPRPMTPASATRSPAEGKPVVHTHKHITPCETTLIPYLDALYADEVEDALAKGGRIEDLAGMAGESGNNGKQHWKGVYKYVANDFSPPVLVFRNNTMSQTSCRGIPNID